MNSLNGHASDSFWSKYDKVLYAVLALIVVAVVASGCGWVKTDQRAVMLLAVAGASVMLGALIGFVFGIPRKLAISAPSTGTTEDSEMYESNTNLEQVSDWVTKIIIGVTLVQLAPIISTLGQYAQDIADRTGVKTDAPLSLGLMILFFVCGFIATYLWARLFLRRALTQADAKRLNALEKEYQADARALEVYTRWMNNAADAPSVEALGESIAGASPRMRHIVLAMAEDSREAGRVQDKPKMLLTTPIFEALYRIDGAKDHRVPANLAYVLKDGQETPPWDRVEKLLTEAIEMRPGGFRVYEAVRGIARIKLGRDVEMIKSDLEAAFQENWVKRWLSKDSIVMDWAGANSYTIPS